MAIYVIEHLEPRVWKWCVIEYKHISSIVGKDNLWITNVKKSKGADELAKFAKVYSESVTELKLKNACVLDPEADKILTPPDAGNFDYLIFGGILGDYPPRKRTKDELTSKFAGIEARNIGKEQMSTDNAVYVVHEIENGTEFSKMKFLDTIEIEISDCESISMPYRYRIVDGKPFVSSELVTFLKKKKGF